ncbi:hypothetical protein [Microcoleus sp. Z1_B2]|uniref:hypothetical protein n=1 Tax=Microcoleus sp. Z1_B2 TaxID=3055429 RepID=UPI002FD1A602
MKAPKLEIGFLRLSCCEAGGRRQEAEGRRKKKCFYKYEMLPAEAPDFFTSICKKKFF